MWVSACIRASKRPSNKGYTNRKWFLNVSLSGRHLFRRGQNSSDRVPKSLSISLKYTERKKKRRVNFIPKFLSSLKKFVKYFTMITKRCMYETKVPNFIGLCSTSLELLKFIGSYPPPILKSKSNWKSISGVPPPPPLLAAFAALILLWIELTKALTVRMGMLFHSSINAFLSYARVPRGGGGISALPNPSVQLIPHVLYWGQIWTVRWPC